MTRYRSAASLLASGIATITLDQRIRMPKVRSTKNAFSADRKALEGDWEAIGGDFRRTLKRIRREVDAA